MCSTISIPIFSKIPKIILRKKTDQFGDFGNGYSEKKMVNVTVESMHNPQAVYRLPDADIVETRCSLVPASAKPIQATLLKI